MIHSQKHVVYKSSSWGTTQVDVSNRGRGRGLRRSRYKGEGIKKNSLLSTQILYKLKFALKSSPNSLSMGNAPSLLWAGTLLITDNRLISVCSLLTQPLTQEVKVGLRGLRE